MPRQDNILFTPLKIIPDILVCRRIYFNKIYIIIDKSGIYVRLFSVEDLESLKNRLINPYNN
jgi:hypothetical protein